MNAFCRNGLVDVETLQLSKINNTMQLSVMPQPTALLGRVGTAQRNKCGHARCCVSNMLLRQQQRGAGKMKLTRASLNPRF